MIGIGHRVDQQVQPIALRAHFGFGGAQLGVVLVDLPRGHAQVGDVAQNRHDAGALARIADDRAEQLEQQVGPFGRIDQQQLAPPGLAFAEGGARQRRREEHVVQLHGAPPPFAHIVRRGEEHFRSRVRDDELAFHVGEQNRIGRGVDDVEEQRVLAAQPGIVFAKSRLGGRPMRPRHRPSASATHFTLAGGMSVAGLMRIRPSAESSPAPPTTLTDVNGCVAEAAETRRRAGL